MGVRVRKGPGYSHEVQLKLPSVGWGTHGADGLGLEPPARTWLYASGEWQSPQRSILLQGSGPRLPLLLQSTAYGCSHNGLVPLKSL